MPSFVLSLGDTHASDGKGKSKSQDHESTLPKTESRKRTFASLNDDSEDENVDRQQITHFNRANGAYDSTIEKTVQGPSVIKAQANRDWRDNIKNGNRDRRRAKYDGVDSKRQAEDTKRQAEEMRRMDEARKPITGLNVMSTSRTQENGNGSDEAVIDTIHTTTNPISNTSETSSIQKTDDDRAMDLLLGIRPQSDLIIPTSTVTEEEAFQRDFQDAPPMATLEEYKAVPVEEFGAAILRGMGWVEGQGIGNQAGQKSVKAKMPQRRPALLGIGAKEDAAIKEEMGAWGKGARKGKVEIIYNPIIMRNKRTGDEVSEEELKMRLEEQKVKDKEIELDTMAASRQEGQKREKRRDDKSRRYDFEDDHAGSKYESKRSRDDQYQDERRRDERRRDESDRDRHRDHGTRRDRSRDDQRSSRYQHDEREERHRDKSRNRSEKASHQRSDKYSRDRDRKRDRSRDRSRARSREHSHRKDDKKRYKD